MIYECLKGLEPADFFLWFGKVSAIPRGSRKEEKIAAFLERFARERGFSCETDSANNVLIQVPASPGYEDQPPFLFQAHTDMVWRKEPGVDLDFETQPLQLQAQGNKITARGTTLGADNAVGMATMLALADGNYPHPPLELLFTAAEEVGMEGIRAFDFCKLKARRMINMDCGDSHVMCVTSAGSISGQITGTFPTTPLEESWQTWELTLSGGKGGHSGICAGMGRACGGNLLGDLLLESPVRLICAEAEGAIIKHIRATFCAPEDLTQTLSQRFARLLTIYKDTDPDWQLTLIPVQSAPNALGVADSANILLALSLLRTGQVRGDALTPKFVLTSGQLKSIRLENGNVDIAYGVRAACDADGDLLFVRNRCLLEKLGLQLAEQSRYSGWRENPDSLLRQQFIRQHLRLFGTDIEIERIHGGIEVGTILGAIKDMDAIGIAPTARGAHTTDEYLLIDQVAPYWKLITTILAEKI